MTRINTNIMSLMAQNNLATSNNELQQSLTRLSTGLRINSGADDPSGLIAAEALQSEIVSTQSGISNSQTATEMIATADSTVADQFLVDHHPRLGFRCRQYRDHESRPGGRRPVADRLFAASHRPDRREHAVQWTATAQRQPRLPDQRRRRQQHQQRDRQSGHRSHQRPDGQRGNPSRWPPRRADLQRRHAHFRRDPPSRRKPRHADVQFRRRHLGEPNGNRH